MLKILILFLIFNLTLSDQWYSKSQCTQKEFANHMDINCNFNEFILIGWSHYGTKKQINNFNSSMKCQPSENDCIMDYTHKIAELCNGVSKCEVILTQQFIHKCSDEATYLFISYQCIQNSTIIDICSKRIMTSSNGLNLISPMFPNEYPNNINCTCSIESKKKSNNIIIDVENLSFNLQDNDKLLSFSGTIPFGASLLTSTNQLNLQFQTDETLTQSGFWIRLYGYQQCNTDEYTLGSKCIKIFREKQTWKSAQEKCLSINSNLIHLHDIIQEKKLSNFILINNDQPNSFWISNEKENYDENSWWPWRSTILTGKCILRTQDGWIKRPCNEEYAFICERDIKQQSIPLTIRCGNAQPTTILSTKLTTITSTQNTTIELISSTINNKLQTRKKNNIIDPLMLAVILGGIAFVILSINILICYICKRHTQIPSKSKTKTDSNSSFTHEELQRSLMQHLYHEKTNTICSTSTSSSSSKNSKSNDTTTTSSNLFQLSPPYSNPTLCFRNPHVGNEQVDYHVYETIPPENLTYTICPNHSAFKPVVQTNTHTIRPYFPRTNVLYHHPDSSNTLSNTTVLMPVCCHHYSSGTLRKPVLSTSQIYTRSESIV